MRRDDQSLHARLQSWVNDRCEARMVVGRQRTDRALFLGLGITLGIVAAKKPVHRRRVPLRSKASTVLARHGRFRLLSRIDREVLTERLNNLLCCIKVIRYR